MELGSFPSGSKIHTTIRQVTDPRELVPVTRKKMTMADPCQNLKLHVSCLKPQARTVYRDYFNTNYSEAHLIAVELCISL